MMIGDIVGRMDETDKGKLRALMNYFLLRMLTNNASDIDMGGYGSGGNIWYRIFGSKKADKSLGQFLPDEMNFLVQSVIG